MRRDLPPAIQYLLLDAAEQIHSGPGIFQRSGQFPAGESVDLPLSDEARQFYRSGRPFLQRQAPIQRLADQVSASFVPAVVVVAILTFVGCQTVVFVAIDSLAVGLPASQIPSGPPGPR